MQAHQKRVNDGASENKRSHAHKRATALFAEEMKKPKDERKLSASKVSELVYGEFGVHIHKRTIQREVAAGRVGLSPLKRGMKGNFPALTFQHLANAFESFIKIKQLNGQGGDLSNNKLSQLLKKCTRPVLECDSHWLLVRLLKKTAAELRCGKANNAEERRVRWTTYFNIKSWFDNWEKDLVKLGFAFTNDNGNTIIPDEQLERILNIDETCLVMDGSKCNRGGRPEVMFYSQTLPNLGKSTIKSSVSTTMITGSTAAGEAIPPHFQFSTTSKSEETQRVNVNSIAFFPKIKGKFGASDSKEWPVTIGMNEKGGMDDVEFRQYFLNSIVPLYPDSNDVNGKRVMVKVDSGPGRLQENFLAEARTLGFIVYPGVPNTTAVTQETDQNYGPFKTQFTKNLKKISDARIMGDLPTSLPPWLVGLLVFGGMDPVSKVVVSESAFDVAFSKDRNCEVWKKVGAAPLTRACLQNHNQVRREMGDAEDATNNIMQLIQSTNNLSTFFLKEHGFDSDVLKASIKKVKK